MARIVASLVPLLASAEDLTEEARELLQVHCQELSRSFPQAMARLEHAIEALQEARDALEALTRAPTTQPASPTERRTPCPRPPSCS
jgi:hypothetical protein